MNGRDIFEVWAPTGFERWSKFAKPALFVNIKDGLFSCGTMITPPIPADVVQQHNETTAIIVDMPSASGVENGLGLAKLGFRPVPLYNGVHEEKIGYLSQMIDHTPIVDALKAGAEVLRDININRNAPPAFLLDYDRNKEARDGFGIYDNRWSLDFEDLPDVGYMKYAGINRVVVWSKSEMRDDLLPIIKSYLDAGIEVMTYIDRQLTTLEGRATTSPVSNQSNQGLGSANPSSPGNQGLGSTDSPRPINQGSTASDTVGASSSFALTADQDDVRKFENARFILLIISGLAFFNLFFMFFVNYEPLLWTAPSIMWLTYLWVPEIVGDAFAVALSCGYLALYFLSLRRRYLISVAAALFVVDVVVFYVYALYYGIFEWYGILGMILLCTPLYLVVRLVQGAIAQSHIDALTDDEYFQTLDTLDNNHYGGSSSRRHFRGYRGYGGSGNGGYSGGGYGRYGGGGGYGGGFGG